MATTKFLAQAAEGPLSELAGHVRAVPVTPGDLLKRKRLSMMPNHDISVMGVQAIHGLDQGRLDPELQLDGD
jgi:hypothetical protein